MLFGLIKNKKVRPAKVQRDDYKAAIPQDYLFWGKRQVVANEDGVDFVYEEKECFLGNTDEGRVASGVRGDAFAMRMLTGANEGELYFPEVKNHWDIFVKVPTGAGIVEYEIELEGFSLGERVQGFYKVGDIVAFAKSQNDAAKQKAFETAKGSVAMQ